MNYSFGLLKPDCLKRGIEKEILAAIEATGLKVIAAKRVRLTREEIEIIYGYCTGENFYDELIEFFLSGDCMAYIVKGNNAIDVLNDVIGHPEPMKAKEHTMRHRFGWSVKKNVIHGTATEEMFWKEILLFFGKEELKHLSVIQGKK